MRIRWLKQAVADLEHAFAYIAEDNPVAARQVAEKVQQAIGHLSEHPSMGRPGRVSGTKELVITGTPFVVPYRINHDTIEILRIFHSARKWPR